MFRIKQKLFLPGYAFCRVENVSLGLRPTGFQSFNVNIIELFYLDRHIQLMKCNHFNTSAHIPIAMFPGENCKENGTYLLVTI